MAVTKLRLNLALPTSPRDAVSSKDALMQNAYIDTDSANTMFAVSRPGFVVGTEGVTSGDNRGIFFHNGTVWIVDSTGGIQGWIPEDNLFGGYYTVTNNQDFV